MRPAPTSSGFTLIELIITIAIVTILTAGTFVALRPAGRISDARNMRRAQDTEAISHAAALRLADGQSIEGINDTWQMIGTATDGCAVQCGAEAFLGNGSDTSVRVTQKNPSASLNFLEPVTFAFWVKHGGGKQGVYLFDSGEENPVTYRAAILGAGYLSFRLRNTNGDLVIWRAATNNNPLNDGNFHHVVLSLAPATSTTYDADKISVYVDDNLLARDTTEPKFSAILPFVPPIDTLRIGGRLVGEENFYADSIIDDFRVYNRELLSSERAELMLGKEISDEDLLAHFTFEEGAGKSLADATGNYEGVIEGTAGWSMDSPSVLARTMTQESCIDLVPELVTSRYIPEIPVNPSAGNVTPTPERTYYAIKQVGALIAVRSCLFEEGASSLLGSTPLVESMRGSVLEP